MIDRDKDVVEWALLEHELEDALEFLDSLIKHMHTGKDFEDVDFGIQLAHIYAHLNRAWNGRDKRGEMTDSEWEAFSKYPSDLYPDGFFPPPPEDT